MRVLITLILLGFIVGFSPAQNKGGRDGSDPTPNIPAYPDSGPAVGPAKGPPAKGPLKEERPEPPILDGMHIQKELDSYAPGQPIHADSMRFSETLTGEVKSLVAAGRRIDKIIVTGFADGIPNRGLNYNLNLLPSNCQKGITLPLDDSELALIRGCVVLEQMSQMVGSLYTGGISWRKDEFDEPDGGRKGNAFRKVRVEIFLRKQ